VAVCRAVEGLGSMLSARRLGRVRSRVGIMVKVRVRVRVRVVVRVVVRMTYTTESLGALTRAKIAEFGRQVQQMLQGA